MLTIKRIIIGQKERKIKILFDKNQEATIWKFGKTTFSSVSELVSKNNLVSLKNVCLRSVFFSPEKIDGINSAQKTKTIFPTSFEKNDIKTHLKPFIGSRIREINEISWET